MSIPPDSPWRGAAAVLGVPRNNATDELQAQFFVDHIYEMNCRVPPPGQRLADIEYRSSYQEGDSREHVFRWDRNSYEHVFLNGFGARYQGDTPTETFYNLERYVNSGGRPLDSQRDTNFAYVSTTLSSHWTPTVDPGVVVRVYRYEIYAPGGIWVAATLENYRFAGQHEVAFPGAIAARYIRSAQLFELRGGRQGTARRRVNTTLFINTNFIYFRREGDRNQWGLLRVRNPISKYLEHRKARTLDIQFFPQRREKRAVTVNDNSIIDYSIEGVTYPDSYINSAFRSWRTDEAYLFIKNEYVLMKYAPGTNDEILNGPLFISGYPSLVGTAFAEYGIDAAFGYNGVDEAFIFCSNLCAKIKCASGTIIEGPRTIKQMFPCLKGTQFEKGVDAAFESTRTDEAYLFNGPHYALINYSSRSCIAIRLITEGFHCFRNTIFESDIGAAFATHTSNEAYLFKGNKYVLFYFTPGTTKDYIIEGPKDIVPNNWPSLKDILPSENWSLDYYDSGNLDPDERHQEL